MDEIIFYPSAAISLFLILFYLYRCHKAKVEFDQTILVNTILQASGVVCGGVLIASTFFEEIRNVMQQLNIYIFISGAVVIATSLKGIKKDIIYSTRVRDHAASEAQEVVE